jgi:hypothetical protein
LVLGRSFLARKKFFPSFIKFIIWVCRLEVCVASSPFKWARLFPTEFWVGFVVRRCPKFSVTLKRWVSCNLVLELIEGLNRKCGRIESAHRVSRIESLRWIEFLGRAVHVRAEALVTWWNLEPSSAFSRF